MKNQRQTTGSPSGKSILVIGAGIGGLVTALRVAHAGCAVTVIESRSTPGGKMRTMPSEAGPVDAGPTVLTMRHVFEALFADLGEKLEDHVTLQPLTVLARHFWEDGTQLDLMADRGESIAAINAVFGSKSGAEFAAFSDRAARLFTAFDAPMMQSATPRQSDLVRHVIARPRLALDMAPHLSLAALLRQCFSEAKLQQLFGRYATYVGGSPYQAPALLSLIWEAEAQGVWAVQGGMQKLAEALAGLAKARGVEFLYDTQVRRISQQSGRVASVETDKGRIAADVVVFNGDPRALHTGLLGEACRKAVTEDAVTPRSLSAYVHAFAASVEGPRLAHHNVFFGTDAQAEFIALQNGERPKDATLYICAQDRIADETSGGVERFEIILNGPPLNGPPLNGPPLNGPSLNGPSLNGPVTSGKLTEKDIAQCQTEVIERLGRFGLRFSPLPGPATLTTPQDFDRLFPASLGSLYGRSPQGLTAGLKRPVARTVVPGLYLAGGGTHPGAGVPMAALSGKHAAEAILSDLTSTSTSRPMATAGGMSTGSAPAGRGPFRSSGS